MNERSPTGLLSIAMAGNNMFGAQPCPKCGSKFRAPYTATAPNPDDRGMLTCDDCGFREPWYEEGA